MREIKFRGKRLDNGEWIYGWVFGNNAKSIIEIDKEYPNEYGVEAYYTSVVIPETVGQYTGINDKNGVEIYEGDIVRFEAIEWTGNNGDRVEYQGVVEYSEEHIAFNYKLPTGLEAIPYETTNIEVIGNIYENPGLLGVK